MLLTTPHDALDLLLGAGRHDEVPRQSRERARHDVRRQRGPRREPVVRVAGGRSVLLHEAGSAKALGPPVCRRLAGIDQDRERDDARDRPAFMKVDPPLQTKSAVLHGIDAAFHRFGATDQIAGATFHEKDEVEQIGYAIAQRRFATDQIAGAPFHEKDGVDQIGYAIAQRRFAIEQINVAREQMNFARSHRWNETSHRIHAPPESIRFDRP